MAYARDRPQNKNGGGEDGPVAAHNATTGEFLGVHSEISRTVNDKFIEFLKTALVEKEFDPFAGSHFARRLLFFEPFRAAAFFGNA